MMKFAHIGKEPVKQQSYISYFLESYFASTIDLTKRIGHLFFVIYKRHTVRRELNSIPENTRIDVGLSREEIERIVASIR